MIDLLIKNGLIYDGEGNTPKVGDVAIKDDKIIKIATCITEDAKEVIDATDKCVIPGLIDPHVHEDWVCMGDGSYELILKIGRASRRERV